MEYIERDLFVDADKTISDYKKGLFYFLNENYSLNDYELWVLPCKNELFESHLQQEENLYLQEF